MRRIVWTIVGLALIGAGVAAWFTFSGGKPPVVEFATVTRGPLVSQLDTNGKTEPAEWSPVHAPRDGEVSEILVQRGATVLQGAPLLRLSTRGIDAEIAAAEARVVQAQAALATVNEGGRPVELNEIDSSLKKLKAEREVAAREEAALDRLVAKQAATGAERDASRDRRARLDLDIAALEQKRSSLIAPSERGSAQAALTSAQRALEAVQARKDDALVRAPRHGVVYELFARTGEWLSAGAPIARIGELRLLRVAAFVDEPELGGLKLGQPVQVTWDALPGKTWQGSVERLPTSIVALGSRQVGEVLTRVENPGAELPAAANVNVRIRIRSLQGVLSIPKEAFRREGDDAGVFVLEGDHVAWRKVATGAASVTHLEVISGLKEGDRVALSSETALVPGMRVTPMS